MTVYYPAADSATLVRLPSFGAAVVSWRTDRGSLGSILPGGHMTEVENTRNGQQRGSGSVELRVPADLENLAVLRTVVAAIGTFDDLDFDAVADLRLAV